MKNKGKKKPLPGHHHQFQSLDSVLEQYMYTLSLLSPFPMPRPLFDQFSFFLVQPPPHAFFLLFFPSSHFKK